MTCELLRKTQFKVKFIFYEYFWQLLENVGLRFIPTSGHAGWFQASGIGKEKIRKGPTDRQSITKRCCPCSCVGFLLTLRKRLQC